MTYKVTVQVSPALRESIDLFCENFKIKKSTFVRRAIEYTYRINQNNGALMEDRCGKNKEKLSSRVSFQIDGNQMRQLEALMGMYENVGMSIAVRSCIRNYLINMMFLIRSFDSDKKG